MLRNESIICISSIDWDFIWQGHQEIMSTLVANGNKVIFIENTGVRPPGIKDIPRMKQRLKNWLKGIKGIRQESDNLYIYSPLIVPFPYSRIARWVNCRLILPVLNKWIKVMDFNNAVIWTFLPTPLSLDIIDNIGKKLLIYYCIDSFTVSSAPAKKIRRSENALLRTADLVFVTSSKLFNYCAQYNNNVYKFPFTVNFGEFEKIRIKDGPMVNELKNIKRPIIGYVGGVHKWIDQGLIIEVAKRLPEYSFVFIGPIQTRVSPLSHLKNIYFLGKQDHSRLPFFINNFDVCIIPYLICDYTNNVYPTKLNEYHAMGKPIVSTELPEVKSFNSENDDLVFIAKSYDEFIDCIYKALNSTDNEIVSKRISSAKSNSWETRISQMSDLIEGTLAKKTSVPIDWQEMLIRFYKRTRRKIIRISTFCLTIYLLLIYTPLIWFLANPLKISQSPDRADAIVVFAGGAGESGKAGQGYQERTQRAVQLYRQGHADHMIFSSGYIYVFHEPQLMKVLATSLHVPEEAIILEDKAKNTYENVKFVNKILNEKNWNKILLVSSIYHMRRVSLVAKKIAPEIKIIYTPIRESRFYAHGIGLDGKKTWKQINLEQIIALMHEYLGIIYYWFKGMI